MAPLSLCTPVVPSSVEKTCATDIVLKEFGLAAPLPLSKPVEVTLVPKQAGRVPFSRAMDMVSEELEAK